MGMTMTQKILAALRALKKSLYSALAWFNRHMPSEELVYVPIFCVPLYV